ncbi:MAG: hypothetical protein R3C01_01125 [Planctomycetaceae bacterium]
MERRIRFLHWWQNARHHGAAGVVIGQAPLVITTPVRTMVGPRLIQLRGHRPTDVIDSAAGNAKPDSGDSPFFPTQGTLG